MKKNFRNWLTGAIITGTAVLIGVLILAMASQTPITAEVADNGADNGTIGDVPEDILNLIANPPEFDCVATVTKYELPTVEHEGEMKVVLTYIPNEVGTAENQRDHTDSVNVSALPAERDRILASICSQPEMAGMVGVALSAKYELLVDANPNLFGQFTNTTPKEWADKVFSGEVSYEEATETMTQLAGLMTIFEVTEETRATAWNYHAKAAITTKANVRPIVENDKQYTGDFLVFNLTRKGLDNCWMQFGINIGVNGDRTKGDQRIAGFDCLPEPPVTQPPCEKDCVPPPPPPPVEKKDPSKDPYPRGNAPDGGGPNVDPGPGTYIPPGDMEQPPDTPRVNPTPPAPTTPPVGSTPDPAPAPQPQPSAPPTNNPVSPDEGNGCAPGVPSC